jgi:hypothetical protein
MRVTARQTIEAAAGTAGDTDMPEVLTDALDEMANTLTEEELARVVAYLWAVGRELEEARQRTEEAADGFESGREGWH